MCWEDKTPTRKEVTPLEQLSIILAVIGICLTIYYGERR